MSKQINKRKVERYRIAAIDDSTHEMLWSFKATGKGVLLIILSAIIFMLLISYLIFSLTPAKTFIPGYPDANSRRAAIQNAITADSLETVIAKWEIYSENLVNIIEGKDPVRIDTLTVESVREMSEEKLMSADSLLRQKIEEVQQFGISSRKTRNTDIEGMHFFTPIKHGSVLMSYDEIMHPSVDIKAPSNSVVMAVLEGTVIEDYWNDEYGYSIVIQHENNIVSIYRHNQKLLKKTGDKVNAGAAIAVAGHNDSGKTNDHLHFELWYNGEAVNPSLYINF